MRLMDMTSGDVWDLMLDYYPNFYTGEEGSDEDGDGEFESYLKKLGMMEEEKEKEVI